jgi:hypothetical protein
MCQAYYYFPFCQVPQLTSSRTEMRTQSVCPAWALHGHTTCEKVSSHLYNVGALQIIGFVVLESSEARHVSRNGFPLHLLTLDLKKPKPVLATCSSHWVDNA